VILVPIFQGAAAAFLLPLAMFVARHARAENSV
jgi:hypothetical protein